MSLQPGSRLGPYEVIAPVGSGGMGQVYRARDLRLQRDVAIKVLPPHVSEHVDLKARFVREAQTLASLSHPHICSVFDVGSEQGVDYLVMEYLEGQTLASRLQTGALPLTEVLTISAQLAEALDAAHRRQIVHRDLKPANIMLTKAGVRLLDFGLAKLAPAGPAGAHSALPTAPAMTGQGQILGTPQYMAPEQIEGLEADARTDVFAFGAVVYEMATGHKAFEGGSAASVMAAIMNREPASMSVRQPGVPASLERIVAKCLAKNPDERWQSVSDLGVVLEWSGEGQPVQAVKSRGRGRDRWFAAWAALATLALVALTIWAARPRGEPAAVEPVRFEVQSAAGPDLSDITMSSTGTAIAFTAFTPEGTSAIFVRDLSGTTRELPATVGAVRPFWSPDGRHLGFAAGGRLSKIAISGGPPVPLCDVESRFAGGTWGRGDTIIFVAGGTLHRIPAAGGTSESISALDNNLRESSHQAPHFLPDGRGYLYLAWSLVPANRAIYMSELGSSSRTRLLTTQSKAVFAQPGYLLYHRDGVLLAHAFDPAARRLSGDPAAVVEGVALDNPSSFGTAAFSVSDTGTLAYRLGTSLTSGREFEWVDRSGTALGPRFGTGLYTSNFDVTEDGKRIAVARRDPAASRYDVWLFDSARHAPTKITADRFLSPNGNVAFSPDGRRIAFSSERSGARDIFVRPSDGTGGDEILLDLDADVWPEDWSKDDRYLIFAINPFQSPNPGDIHALQLFGDRKSFPVLNTVYIEDEPRLSPDGQWLAYASNETGDFEVHLVAFPAGDRKRAVSVAGGTQPRWRRDGRELFYLAPNGALMGVDVRSGPALQLGTPQVLFRTGIAVDPIRDQYGVTGDGSRFLLQRPVGDASPAIQVMTNWTSLLTRTGGN